MLYRTVLGGLATLVIATTSGWAQDGDLLNHWYGSGVHAYFSGDTTKAMQDLTQAVEAGSKDPRVYYFRALTYMKMGYADAAGIDMQTGGELEAQDRDGRYPVSRSLERVQGNQRQSLEKFRRKARAANYQRQLVRRRQRYEALRRSEGHVLRRQIAVPLDRLAVPAAATAPIEQPVASPPTAPQPRSLPPVPPVAGGQPAPIAAEASVPAPRPAPTAAASQPEVEVTAPPAGAARAPSQPVSPALPAVKAVPEGEKVGAGRLGRILGRVIGRSLPEGETPAGAAAGSLRDPFGDSPPETTPEAPLPAPRAVPGTSPQPASPDDLFGGDTTDVTPPAAPAVAPADQPAGSDPIDDASDPFGDTDPPPAAAPPSAGGSDAALDEPDQPDQPGAGNLPDVPETEENADPGNPFGDG